VARPPIERRIPATSARSSLPWLSPARGEDSVEGPATAGAPGLGPRAYRHGSPGCYGSRLPCVDLHPHSEAYLGAGLLPGDVRDADEWCKPSYSSEVQQPSQAGTHKGSGRQPDLAALTEMRAWEQLVRDEEAAGSNPATRPRSQAISPPGGGLWHLLGDQPSDYPSESVARKMRGGDSNAQAPQFSSSPSSIGSANRRRLARTIAPMRRTPGRALGGRTGLRIIRSAHHDVERRPR
jgi:hypothetical protein